MMFQSRLRQLGCTIAWGNHFLVRATMIYSILARPGKYKSEVSLHQSYHSSYIKNHILISYEPLTYSDFLTSHILFCYSGTFGQAVLWLSLPNRAIKKWENCRSLFHSFKNPMHAIYQKTPFDRFTYLEKFKITPSLHNFSIPTFTKLQIIYRVIKWCFNPLRPINTIHQELPFDDFVQLGIL